MKIALSSLAALVAFVASPVAGFTCTWRGGDYSWFTYYEDLEPYCCVPYSGTCPQGWLTGYRYCGETFYENCYNCGTGNAYCCEDPYSKQYARETKTQCCQCAGDTVYDPFTEQDITLTQNHCNAAVRCM